MMHHQRGQTLPLTLGGIIAMLVFGFFALNYANTLRWQIRAQNAADSAAQAILTLQTQEFNAMNAALYAAAVEEYRVRSLLNGMVLASHEQGGCRQGALLSFAATAPAKIQCDIVEQNLENAYNQAVSRYTDDVITLQRTTATLNLPNVISDSQALLTRIKDCTGPLGGDCAFHYGALTIQPRLDTQLVDMDAKRIVRPYPFKGTPPSGVNTQLFAPVNVEVSVCAVVPSLIPSFLNWTFAPFRAIARGAATPVMVEEDWLQPGTIPNPFTNQPYQPQEIYTPGPFNPAYDVDFGGNANVVVGSGPNQGYGSTLNTGFLSAYLGWWNSIPIHSFSGPKPSGALGCTS
jgi:hypothetical protein